MNTLIARAQAKFERRKNRKEKEAKRAYYIKCLQGNDLLEKAILLEARNGKEIDGNIFYIVRELLSNPAYDAYKLHVLAEKEKMVIISSKLQGLLASLPNYADEKASLLARLEIIEEGSLRNFELAACAKFIVSDATLKNFFIKREGQVYLNVWHGTPFKVMGKKVLHEPHAIGNAQKNFNIADYLLYPNEYMMEHMIEDYMIANTSSARILLGGYPRNTAFFDEARRAEIIEEKGLASKRIYVYMPTHRPSLMGDSLAEILDEMDAELNDEELLFVKIHPLAEQSVSLENYEKILPYPAEYESYEFLNVADCLITDYSSVFYDFAISSRPIVLFTYDEEDYLSTRGLYSPMSSLPFPQTKSVKELFSEARKEKSYDDKAFLEEYCSYESPTAAAELCARFILGDEGAGLREASMPANGKKNILVHAGDLAPGERREKLFDFIAEEDTASNNYFVVFKRAELESHKEILLEIPEEISFYGIVGKAYETGNPQLDKELERKRCFGEMRIDDEIIIK